MQDLDLRAEPTPEIYYTDIRIGKEYINTCIIEDIFNPKVIKANNISEYLIFKIKPISGFVDEIYDFGLKYLLHFSKASFVRAWNKAPNYQKIEHRKKVDVKITFCRETKKKLKILEREWIDPYGDLE